jgi:hypothetical protein
MSKLMTILMSLLLSVVVQQINCGNNPVSVQVGSIKVTVSWKALANSRTQFNVTAPLPGTGQYWLAVGLNTNTRMVCKYIYIHS